jgi:hypothetical protein
MSKNQFSFDSITLRALNKATNRRTKTPRIVDNRPPYFSGFPSSIVACIVFKSQIKGNSDTENTNGLPIDRYIKI